MRLLLLVIMPICFFLPLETNAQVGGNGAYGVLNLPITSRSVALGGKVVALDDPSLDVIFTNPAHLQPSLNNHISLSFVSYYADIKYGFLSYAKHLHGVGTVGIGLQHVDYGSFLEADATGQVTGTFSGFDMVASLLYSFAFDSILSFGVNVKPIYSHLERYTSFGLCADLGVNYSNSKHLFTGALVIRNMGAMLKPYTYGTCEPLPFEVVVGFSKKLQHAPFRFVATFQQLQTASLSYRRQPNSSSFFDDPYVSSPSRFERVGGELISHLIVGLEFMPVKSFAIRLGYNFQRRNEMKLEQIASLAGFSWGLGVKVNRFIISYSRATYHLAGASNHFSVSTSLEEFLPKRNLPND